MWIAGVQYLECESPVSLDPDHIWGLGFIFGWDILKGDAGSVKSFPGELSRRMETLEAMSRKAQVR